MHLGQITQAGCCGETLSITMAKFLIPEDLVDTVSTLPNGPAPWEFRARTSIEYLLAELMFVKTALVAEVVKKTCPLFRRASYVIMGPF